MCTIRTDLGEPDLIGERLYLGLNPVLRGVNDRDFDL